MLSQVLAKLWTNNPLNSIYYGQLQNKIVIKTNIDVDGGHFDFFSHQLQETFSDDLESFLYVF